ncbi:hypothetical protein [Phormidium sp. CCY1219]|uniref:hypothetical protein n=1 Tax=Phormidium sp. CCY1219 TaxID=2886104 RepID=UPI002D1F175C|nr:hypothetical protein [Phormidium sp. CCY1219]MEB3826075.1 hypothetical protein [Phormidium sp. CCY1219]
MPFTPTVGIDGAGRFGWESTERSPRSGSRIWVGVGSDLRQAHPDAYQNHLYLRHCRDLRSHLLRNRLLFSPITCTIQWIQRKGLSNPPTLAPARNGGR